MGLKPYYLGDTSAIARFAHPKVAVRLHPLLEGGLVYDHDFELIASVTSQPTEWIVPVGTVP